MLSQDTYSVTIPGTYIFPFKISKIIMIGTKGNRGKKQHEMKTFSERKRLFSEYYDKIQR